MRYTISLWRGKEAIEPVTSGCSARFDKPIPARIPGECNRRRPPSHRGWWGQAFCERDCSSRDMGLGLSSPFPGRPLPILILIRYSAHMERVFSVNVPPLSKGNPSLVQGTTSPCLSPRAACLAAGVGGFVIIQRKAFTMESLSRNKRDGL